MVSSKALSNAPCIVMVTPQFNPINAGVSNAVTRFAFAIAKSGFLVIVITPQVIDKNIMRQKHYVKGGSRDFDGELRKGAS